MSHPEPPSEQHAAWRERLSPLAGDDTPDARLRDRTVDALHRSGYLSSSRRPRPWRVMLQAAAVVLLVAGGVMVGRWRAAPAEPAGQQYALLLLEDSTFAPGVSEERLVQEYSAWARELAGRGNLVLGEQLGAEIALGPAVETGPGRVTGLFIIAAAGAAEAEAIARSCPHLRYGGSIRLRTVVPT